MRECFLLVDWSCWLYAQHAYKFRPQQEKAFWLKLMELLNTLILNDLFCENRLNQGIKKKINLSFLESEIQTVMGFWSKTEEKGFYGFFIFLNECSVCSTRLSCQNFAEFRAADSNHNSNTALICDIKNQAQIFPSTLLITLQPSLIFHKKESDKVCIKVCASVDHSQKLLLQSSIEKDA